MAPLPKNSAWLCSLAPSSLSEWSSSHCPHPNPSPPQPTGPPRVARTLPCPGVDSLATTLTLGPTSFLHELYYNLIILESMAVTCPVHPSAHSAPPGSVGLTQDSQGAPHRHLFCSPRPSADSCALISLFTQA